MRCLSSRAMGTIVGMALAATAAASTTPDAPPGLSPWQKMGGLVSIPGAPLPPVPADSVRTAIALYEPLLAGYRVFSDGPSLARGYGYLATLYAAVNDIPKAERLFDDAERILTKHSAGGRDLAWLHNNRGLVQLNEGEHRKALQSFRSAVAAIDLDARSLLEPRVTVLQNLAATYCHLGDAEQSESNFLEALETLRTMGKEGSRAHQVTRGNLALLYATIGDHEGALEILAELVTERGMPRTLQIQILNNLGYTLTSMKRFPEAEKRLREAEALASNGTAEHALALMNLTAMYTAAGNFEKTDEVGGKALDRVRRLYGDNSRMAAAVRSSLSVSALARGELLKADRLLTEARTILSRQSGDQEAFAFITRGLALVAQRRGQTERARQLSREALDIAKLHLERILAFGSEAQRLAWRSQASPYDQLANLGDANLLADAVLAMKGVVLESLLAERALARNSSSSEDREQLDRVSSLRLEIMQKIGRGDAELEELRRELKRAETALAKRVAPRLRHAGTSSPDRVQALLADGQVLIEVIQYERYENGGKLVPVYGAVVISRKKTEWVPLGTSAVIDGLIEKVVTRFGGDRGAGVKAEHQEVVSSLRELHDRIWKPLSKAFPDGTAKVVISPDAATCFLPWATLLDENETFIAEQWQLMQVASGRDLAQQPVPSAEKTLLALGDGGEDLPFSQEEIEAIAGAARGEGWRATTFVGESASEQELFRRPRPRILHLATHGGQLEGDVTDRIARRLTTNPMYRGYVLLGGGNQTLESWKHGSAIPFAMDGILTAEEASTLDLSDTWLTVLSACETGAGELRTGEGVLGLRRGFALAGSKNLLLSLWPVKDDATAEFMKAFYERLFRTGEITAAFHETQVAELRRWRDKSDATAAVYRAGGFILTR